MEARVITTGEIVNIIRNSAFDKDVFYDSDGQEYNRKELSFDFKEKSFPKDEDYRTRLEHQYVGMAMQGILSNPELFKTTAKNAEKFGLTIPQAVAIDANCFARALVEKMKEERK